MGSRRCMHLRLSNHSWPSQDLLTSISDEYIFVPKCTKLANLTKSAQVREIICDLHWLSVQHRITSSYKLPGYVFWCTLYIPAIVHLICLISLLLSQISLPESISDLSGLTVINHWQLGWSLACFSHTEPKAWNSLPQETQEISDSNIVKHKLKKFLFEYAFSTLW